jgi:hypothetical protein
MGTTEHLASRLYCHSNTAKCTCKSCAVHVFNVQPAISAAADEQPIKHPACFVSVTDRTAQRMCHVPISRCFPPCPALLAMRTTGVHLGRRQVHLAGAPCALGGVLMRYMRYMRVRTSSELLLLTTERT